MAHGSGRRVKWQQLQWSKREAAKGQSQSTVKAVDHERTPAEDNYTTHVKVTKEEASTQGLPCAGYGRAERGTDMPLLEPKQQQSQSQASDICDASAMEEVNTTRIDPPRASSSILMADKPASMKTYASVLRSGSAAEVEASDSVMPTVEDNTRRSLSALPVVDTSLDDLNRTSPSVEEMMLRHESHSLTAEVSPSAVNLPIILPTTPVSPAFNFTRNPHSTFPNNHKPNSINTPRREFPSLGTPLQQQQSNAAPSMWSNPSSRTASQNQSGLQRSNQNLQLQQDDLSHFGSNGEAYRFGRSPNQLAGLAQTPTQAQGGDDFPPLSENESRNNILGAFSSQPGAGPSSRLAQEQGVDQALRGLGDRNPTPRGRTLTNPNPFPVPESSQALGFGSGVGSVGLTNAFSNSNPVGFRQRTSQLDYTQASSTALSPDSPFGQIEPQNPSSGAAVSRSRQVSGNSNKLRLSEMTSRQREGLLGLAARLDPEHPDFSPLALGEDLTQLGLDLNRPDSTPLYATFATPFGPANQASRPAVPDFTLPAAYRVQNVPPLHEKIPSFSDEALLAVFYSMPKDLAQEMAAQELYNRDWRWHIRHHVWLQKDQSYAAPTRVSMKEERGFYVIWNAQQWRKERREFTLNYDDLEQRAGPQGFN